MPDGPLVSILTPAWQCGKFIGNMIESIQAQTYGNWELIIVDDGSTDDTLAVAQSYAAKDKRIIVKSIPHSGNAAASNTCFDLADGEIIARQDADDWSAKWRLEYQVEELMQTNCDIVSCGMVSCQPGTETDMRVTGMSPWEYVEQPVPEGPGGPTLVAFRQVYERVGPYLEEYAAAGDSYWNYKALSLDNPPLLWHHLPSLHYFYRRHEGQMTRRIHHKQMTDHKKAQSFFTPVIEERLKCNNDLLRNPTQTVLIETCQGTHFIPTLNCLAEACRRLGYRVARWYHKPPLPVEADILFWFGPDPTPLKERMVHSHPKPLRVILIEAGWTLDRNQCLQIDEKGCNGLASWAEEPFDFTPEGPIEVRKDGDLLVCLRYERENRATDNVHVLCPGFPSNHAWVDHINQANPGVPIRLRPHFATKDKLNIMLRDVARRNKWEWDDPNVPLTTSIKRAKAVAVLDSSAGVQAMELGLPVLCFGRQVYRFPNVVSCLNSDVVKTNEVLRGLAKGNTDIDKGAVKAMLARIRSRQWYRNDIDLWPARLQKEFKL